MAFTEADRVNIRIYLGFGSLFLQADSRLESAISAIQSVADGGTRPTSDAETSLKAILTKLQAIDNNIDSLAVQQGATAVDEIKVDAARELARLRMVGRSYVNRMALMLDTFPRADVFSSAPQLGAIYPEYPRTSY